MAIVNFKNAKFVTSALDLSSRPKTNKIYPEVVFVGKSNVGKSSLINALTGQKIAFSSKKAGKTQLLNYFLVDDSFYLVDAPGWGFTAYGSKLDTTFAEMMEPYFESNPNLKAVFLLIDGRRGLSSDDKAMLDYLNDIKMPTILVYTKADTLKQQDKHRIKLEAEGLKATYCLTSNKQYPEEIRRLVVNAIRGKEQI